MTIVLMRAFFGISLLLLAMGGSTIAALREGACAEALKLGRFQPPVDFDQINETIEHQPYFAKAILHGSFARNLMDHAAESGIFERFPMTRNQRLYFFPGLNAGVPHATKPDLLHRGTYLFHDMMHMAVSDLIIEGEPSALADKVFVLRHMMGEAISMVLADMIYVSTLDRAGIKYDYAARKIYPVFLETGLDPEDSGDIRKLIEANIQFMLTGRDDKYRELIPHPSKALQAFEQWYAPVAAADYHWVLTNLRNMRAKGPQLTDWWQAVSGLARIDDLGLSTAAEYAKNFEGLSGDALLNAVMNHVIETLVKPALLPLASKSSAESSKRRAFLRWVMGQCAVFSFFPAEPALERQVARNGIILAVRSLYAANAGAALDSTIAGISASLDEYISTLERDGIVTAEDAQDYRSAVPQFPPHSVSYSKNNYGPVQDYYREVSQGVP